MNTDEQNEPILKTTLTFFNNQLSDLNNKRLQLNRSKGLAKYVTKSFKNVRDLTPLDTTMGVMSFSLYALRFSANAGLLVQLFISKPKDQMNQKLQRDLYLSLFNDCLWSIVNLTQFFWLSYRNSNAYGLHGMQLETLAQFIDLLVMLLRYQHDKEEYELKYDRATESERDRLIIEWQNKQLNMLRSLLTGVTISVMFGLFSFSVIAVPLAPIIASIIVLSSLIKLLIDVDKDKKLVQQDKINGMNPQQIINEERLITAARLKDLNQIVLTGFMLPLGVFLLITTPISWFLMIGAAMLVSHNFLAHLIETEYTPFKDSLSLS